MKELINVVLPVSRLSLEDVKKLSKDEIMALVDADLKSVEDRLFLASMIPSDLFDTSLLSNEDQAKLSRAMYENLVPEVNVTRLTLNGTEEYKVPTDNTYGAHMKVDDRCVAVDTLLSKSSKPTNLEVLQNMTLEELATELSLIATWDRKEVNKIKGREKEFFMDWLCSHSLSDSNK